MYKGGENMKIKLAEVLLYAAMFVLAAASAYKLG
jgi:hypothetical protein